MVLFSGKVGIVVDTDWYEPATSSEEDKAASHRSLLFRVRIFHHFKIEIYFLICFIF